VPPPNSNKPEKNMCRWIILLVFLAGPGFNAEGCRFTVREIGFSTLSHDIYSLVVIDNNTSTTDQKWNWVRDTLEDSNIRLLVLHPEHDAANPHVKEAISGKSPFPAYFLIAPDGRKLELGKGEVSEIVDRVLNSGIRNRLRNDFSEVFSVILWIEGKDKMKNTEAGQSIMGDCKRIESIMPYMPKEVRNGPVPIRISAGDFHSEKILLWSLGIEEQPKEPAAFVLYGRGRIIGDEVNAEAISEGMLYKYMSMIGADCECGLDRKWMLGKQIPLLWPSENRQKLAYNLGFDVDNPMILSEMSMILAKETNPELVGDVSFGIETIDLDSAFGQIPEILYDKESPANSFNNLLLISLLLMVGIILTGGLILFRKNRKK